ncbi:LysR family transcriptional regulator [Shewanella salipaludis]|uniref:LysR family transcriptional regulator n=1 Tax=Shewanella salipaludis TaxID=2723052 RepID=A0A972G6N8_9GAMM|nr:LysR family transcriptional regulator [Shewanella salipaludis]NMH65490.1 LysR family transcriptional regulator [Shewanella salipaludis]
MYSALNLDALRVLDAIDKKGSFSAAADALYKVPSALTYTVQKLESELGAKLFDRSGQRAVLTQVGRLVLTQGREILAATTRLEEAVRQLETGWERRLILAKDTVVPDAPLFGLVREFCELGKQIELELTEESLGGSWDALYSGRVDIAIGVGEDRPKGQYQVHKMAELNFVFAISPSHPLAQSDAVISSEALLQFPSVVVADSSRSLPQRSSGLFESRQVIRVPNMRSKIEAQQAGAGVGFIPRHLIAQELAQGSLLAREVALPRAPQALYVAWRKDNDARALNWFASRLPTLDWGID